MTLLEAYEFVSFSESFEGRLKAAFEVLSQKQGLADEKSWFEAAILRVEGVRAGLGDVLTRAVRLPELEALRADWADSLQHAAVEAVEHLEAGIAFHGGVRSPLLEALYAKLKLPALRRADREDFEKFAQEFEKRLNSSYAKRMFADGSLALLAPAVEQVKEGFTQWRGSFNPPPLSPDEARALEDELTSLARQLELPMRQARLLAEAALAPVRNAFEDSGLAAKAPRRRLARTESPAVPPEASLPPHEEPPLALEPVEKPRRKGARS